jgi:hypothetical protein
MSCTRRVVVTAMAGSLGLCSVGDKRYITRLPAACQPQTAGNFKFP